MHIIRESLTVDETTWKALFQLPVPTRCLAFPNNSATSTPRLASYTYFLQTHAALQQNGRVQSRIYACRNRSTTRACPRSCMSSLHFSPTSEPTLRVLFQFLDFAKLPEWHKSHFQSIQPPAGKTGKDLQKGDTVRVDMGITMNPVVVVRSRLFSPSFSHFPQTYSDKGKLSRTLRLGRRLERHPTRTALLRVPAQQDHPRPHDVCE